MLCTLMFVSFRAIWGGHFSIVKLLVEGGANVNIANNNKQKAIQLAKSKDMKAYLEAAAMGMTTFTQVGL